MPKLQTITVRTASRMPIGKGFQEVGVSLSYLLDGDENTAKTAIAAVRGELRTAIQDLWTYLDAAEETDRHP